MQKSNRYSRRALKCLQWHGWRITDSVDLPRKCVICLAPHTSNWDFVLGMLYKRAKNIRAAFFIKKEWFRFPFGAMMRRFGGIPVDRSKKTSLTDQIAEEFEKHEHFCIAVTPEGTRSKNSSWKRGFYYIAQKAKVPIALAYIDYAKKEIGVARLFEPSGDIEHDLQTIKQFYSTITAKRPDLFAI